MIEDKELIIRTATLDDAEELLKIYAPYVEDTAISFEYEVPTVDEFRSRIENTLKKYPYIVAEVNGKIAGYSYCGEFKSRAAYNYDVETTIYLSGDMKGKGIGRRLYLELEERLKKQNILNMNACIATIDIEDEHLTNGSTKFHEKMGYRTVGEFRQCGYKFGRWYNMIWMEKMIGDHTDNPKPFIAFADL